VDSGLALSFTVQGGVRFPAICAFDSLTIALVRANDAAGTSWASPETVATLAEDPSPGQLDMVANPLDGSPVIFGPSPDGARNMSVYREE
jgi:hypothetical protein